MTRTYLVVIDDSAEARVALRFAARRAAKTDGAVEVLAVVKKQDFVQWGGVQAAIEEEQRLRIEASVAASASEIVVPIVRDGELVAVLDLDSPNVGRFDVEDEAGCVRLGEILATAI